MTEQELQKQRDREEDLQRLRGFRPVDDTFMRVLFRDNLPLAEYVLRLITEKPDLTLTREETQKDLVRLVGARGLCLDVHGVDDEGHHYDLEVQRADAGARPERARYLKTDPEGVDIMCKVMEDMRNEAIQRGIDQNRIESIKNVMESFKVDALKIPVADQPKYLNRL